MKTRGILASVALVALVACLVSACIDSTPPSQPSAEPGTGITWYSYDEGMKIAQEQNKPVIIDIYRDLCGNCKYMDQNTFADPEVIELADRFVCIKVNLDKPGGKEISARHGAYYGTLPFIIFLREDGSKAHQSDGLKYPKPFVHEMMVALNNT